MSSAFIPLTVVRSVGLEDVERAEEPPEEVAGVLPDSKEAEEAGEAEDEEEEVEMDSRCHVNSWIISWITIWQKQKHLWMQNLMLTWLRRNNSLNGGLDAYV